MDNKKVYTSTVRLYKDRPVHNQAYEYLKHRNKDIFKSNDDFIAEAIIYFSQHLRKEQYRDKEQEIKAYFEDRANPMFEMVKTILKEVLDEKFMELYDRGAILANLSPERKSDITDCSDRDKRFASFYDL